MNLTLKKDFEELVKNAPIIYKYISFEGGMKTLIDQTLLFKNPTIFNDPYDCYTELVSFDKIPINYRNEIIKKYRPNISRQERRLELKKSTKIITDYELSEMLKNQALPAELMNRGVSCFSRTYKELLMWSHYADSHKGFCIGFDLQKTLLWISQNGFNENSILPVKYAQDIEPLDYFDNEKFAVIEWLRTKAACWSYEKEVRIVAAPIVFDKTKIKVLNFPSSLISEVYLGNKIEGSTENKNIISKKLPNAKIYNMELNKRSFKLEETRVN